MLLLLLMMMMVVMMMMLMMMLRMMRCRRMMMLTMLMVRMMMLRRMRMRMLMMMMRMMMLRRMGMRMAMRKIKWRRTRCRMMMLRMKKMMMMMIKISQEPLDTEIYRKNAAAQTEPRTQTNTLCEPAQSKRKDFTRATLLYGNSQVRCCRPKLRRWLCAILRNRNECQDFTRATLCRKFAGKMPQTKMSPERGHRLCANLRSWNTCQDFTKATLCGNLQVKCRMPDWAPWSSTDLYTCRKNPSVWTHCLGNNFCRMYFGSWKGRFFHFFPMLQDAASYKCACLFSATFQTTLCRCILFCEFVHAWDNCSKDTVNQNNRSRRRLWQQEKRRHDKRRQEVECRETLCASLRASQNEPRTPTAQNADIHFVRACGIETHVKISQGPLYTEIHWKNAVVQNRARRLFTSLRSRNACRDFSVIRNSISRRWFWQQEKRRRDKRRHEVERREALRASLRASQNEPRTRTAQNTDIYFVRACGVETHVKISQGPLYTEIHWKNATPQNESRTQTKTLCEPAESKRMSKFHKTVETLVKISQEPLYYTEILRKNAVVQNRAADFNYASLRSRNACRDFRRVTSYGNLQVKCCRPKPRRRLCAILRNRNACQDFTRATLYWGLQVKCHRRE